MCESICQLIFPSCSFIKIWHKIFDKSVMLANTEKLEILFTNYNFIERISLKSTSSSVVFQYVFLLLTQIANKCT